MIVWGKRRSVALVWFCLAWAPGCAGLIDADFDEKTLADGAGGAEASAGGTAAGVGGGLGGSGGVVSSGGSGGEFTGGASSGGASSGGALGSGGSGGVVQTGGAGGTAQQGEIAVNEVLWIGVGEFIELYNRTATPRSLEGYSLVAGLTDDDLAEAIPFGAGFTIQGNDFVVARPSIAQCQQPCLEYGFSTDVGTVYLLDPQGEVVDSMELPSPSDGGPTWGLSYGRRPDGGSMLRVLVATAGDPNRVP